MYIKLQILGGKKMALNSLNIISSSEAESWKKEVLQLNEETHKLLTEVGNALQEVHEDADSTIVDEIYKYGGQILSNTNNILEGMNGLVSMVTNLLSKVNEVLDSGKNIVKGIVKSIGGLS